MYRVPASYSRHTLLRYFQSLVRECNQDYPVEPGPQRLNHLLAELCRTARQESLLVLVSDFLGCNEETAALMQRLSRRHEILLFWIHDRIEIESWEPGPYPLKVQGRDHVLDTRTRNARNWISQRQDSYRLRIQETASRFSNGLVQVSCNEDTTHQLSRYLRA